MMKIFISAAYQAYLLMNFTKLYVQQGKRTYTFQFHAYLEDFFENPVGDVRDAHSSFGNSWSQPFFDTNWMPTMMLSDQLMREQIMGCRKKYLVPKNANPATQDLPKWIMMIDVLRPLLCTW